MKSTVTYEEWLQFATYHLADAMERWPTMIKVISTLRLPEKLAKSAVEMELSHLISACRLMLYQRFLPNSGPVQVDSTEIPLANFLAAEGVLSPDPLPPMFKIPSPVIHSLVMKNMVPLLQHPRPSIPVPFTCDGESLDVLLLMKGCLQSFNRDLLKIARWRAYKACRVPGSFNRKHVPQEDVYQTELYSTLRSWLPIDFKVIPHPNSGLCLPNDSPGSRKRSEAARKTDIIVELSPNHRLLFELVASAHTKELQDHFDRATNDAEALNAKEAWVIHFTVVTEADTTTSTRINDTEEEAYKYPFPKASAKVKALHVWHNYDFTDARIFFVDNDGMKKEEKVHV